MPLINNRAFLFDAYNWNDWKPPQGGEGFGRKGEPAGYGRIRADRPIDKSCAQWIGQWAGRGQDDHRKAGILYARRVIDCERLVKSRRLCLSMPFIRI